MFKLQTKLLLGIVFLFVNLSETFAQTISGSTNVCGGQVVTYSTTVNAAQYNWTANGSASISPNGNEVAIEWGNGNSGTVHLIALDINGQAVANTSLNVSIALSPNAFIITSFSADCERQADGSGTYLENYSDSCFAACINDPITYTAPPISGAIYDWEILGDGNLVAQTSSLVEISWQSIGTQYLKLVITNSNGCADSIIQCIEVIESPKAAISSIPLYDTTTKTLTTCVNTEIQLYDNSVGAVSRMWIFGDGTFSSETAPSKIYDTPGTYELILDVNNGCNCEDSDTITVIVDAIEGPEIVCPAVVCEGDTATYSTPASCQGYQWTATNGTIVGSNTNATVDVVWNNHLGYLTLEGTSCLGKCAAPTTVKIPVISDSILIEGPEFPCPNTQVRYSIPPIPGSTYNWTVPSTVGTILNQEENEIIVDVTGSTDGTISVTYDNQVVGCMETTSKYVQIKPPLNLEAPSEVCFNDTTTIEVMGLADWEVLDSNFQVVYSQTNTSQLILDWQSIGVGTFQIKAVNTTLFCNSNDNMQVTVLAPPPSPDTILGKDTVCGGNAYTYTVNPKSGYTIDWQVIGGMPIQKVGNRITVKWDNNSPYELKAAYRQMEKPNCYSNYLSKVIVQKQIPTTVIRPDTVCGGDTVFVELDHPADVVEWEISPATAGSIVTDRLKSKIGIVLSAGINQAVHIIASGSSCGQFFSRVRGSVYVENPPLPPISYNANCQGNPITFSTITSNYDSLEWLIDGVLYTDSTPTVTFNEVKSVNITLTAFLNNNAASCQSTVTNSENLLLENKAKAFITTIDPNENHCIPNIYQIQLVASVQGDDTTNGYHYSWYRNGVGIGSSKRILSTPPHYGYYELVATSPLGCRDTAILDFQQEEDCNLGMPCIGLENDSIYSPIYEITYDTLHVDTADSLSQYYLDIHNLDSVSIIDTTNYNIDSIIYTIQHHVRDTLIVYLHDANITISQDSCNEFHVSAVNTVGATLIGISLDAFINKKNVNEGFVPLNTGPYNLGFKYPRAGYYTLAFVATFIKTAHSGQPGDTFNIGDTLCKTFLKNIVVNVVPDFDVRLKSCDNIFTYEFINTSTYVNDRPSYDWDFGSGVQVDTGLTPEAMLFYGTHNITLMIDSTCSIIKEVDVPQLPTAAFTASAQVCQQEPIAFTNQSSGNIVSYKWNIDGKASYDENPSATFETPPNYSFSFDPFVELYITDNNGCRDTAVQQISVRGNDLAGEIDPNTLPAICEGDSVELEHFQQDPYTNTPISYLWSTLETTPSIQAKSSGNYQLTITDAVGCRKNMDPVNLQVNIPPNPIIAGKKEYCEGEAVQLLTYAGKEVEYDWIKDGSSLGLNSTTYESELTPGNYTFRVEILDSVSNCIATSPPFDVVVHPTPQAPTISSSQASPICENSGIKLSTTGATAYRWSTGETTDTITANAAGIYKLYITDANGCEAEDSIKVNPLPDFSNFLTGCYCLHDSSVVNLPGIPNMASYQWFKNGNAIPGATSKNIAASGGVFELAATTYAGCTDTAGVLDITTTGCSDFCEIELSNLNITCGGKGANGFIFNIEFEADFSSHPLSPFTTQLLTYLNSSIVQNSGFTPGTINDGIQQFSAQVELSGMTPSDILCMQLIAEKDGIQCTATICDSLPNDTCGITPAFTYQIDPTTCVLSLNTTASIDPCTVVDPSDYSWDINAGGTYSTYSGTNINIGNLPPGEVEVCHQLLGYNYTGTSDCHPTVCDTIEIPDCACKNNCDDAIIKSVRFEKFIKQEDSCVIQFRLTMSNSSGGTIDIEELFAQSGKVLSYSLLPSTPGTYEYLVNYYPEQPWKGGKICFELYLNTIDDLVCCQEFCIELPKCNCNLNLNNLNIGCVGPDNDASKFHFSIDAFLDGSSNFNYQTTLTATLNGSPVNILHYQPDILIDGVQTVDGEVELFNMNPGDSLCLTLTAELGGISCVATICEVLPNDLCDIIPDFTYQIDPYTCALTLTSTSDIDSCTVVAPGDYSWSITTPSNTYSANGKEVRINNLPEGEVSVCLTVLGYSYTGTQDCHPSICKEIQMPDCPCEEDGCDISINTADFVQFVFDDDSCIADIQIVLENLSGGNLSLNGVRSSEGSIIDIVHTNQGSSTATFDIENYLPNDWGGGEICFDLFLKIDEVECCIQVCIDVPACDAEEAPEGRIKAKADIPAESSISVYPNPTRDILYISSPNFAEGAFNLQLMGQDGKLVLAEIYSATSSTITLKVGNLPAGVYVLEIEQFGQKIRKKIIVMN